MRGKESVELTGHSGYHQLRRVLDEQPWEHLTSLEEPWLLIEIACSDERTSLGADYAENRGDDRIKAIA
ncbi:MAG: hypothetical protein IT495_15450 [Gammaproteobacteria bacterium]|nr:hypothetical protein [Gammaproteobacteria bacterium]